MIPPHELPSEEAIRAMDGPALTRLAFALGLAPEDSYEHLDGSIIAHRDDWEPHADIAQARDVLDRLRKDGWDTHIQFFAQSHHGQLGAWKRLPNTTLIGLLLPWDSTASEAEATLRCACLVVAYQQREETTHADA